MQPEVEGMHSRWRSFRLMKNRRAGGKGGLSRGAWKNGKLFLNHKHHSAGQPEHVHIHKLYSPRIRD